MFTACEFLFAFRPGVQHPDQDAVEIVDMEIDVDRRPMSLISANVVGSLRRAGSRRFLNQADLAAAALENDIGGDRSSDFDKTQCATIKSQPLIELRDVDCNGIVHV